MSSSYLPRLDGIRAVAIGFVLLEHFSSKPFFRAVEIGGIGVRLFFVLSGFLITRILIGYRRKAMAPAQAAKQFYWRRLLRLSPPYYLALAVTGAFAIGGVDHTWWIHALYLTNFHVALQGHWDGSSHLWSLSVEEQFYLLWFLVVMMLPERFLIPVIWLCILGAPLFRAAVLLLGYNGLAAYVLLPAAMDALAAGAFLAHLATSPGHDRLRMALRDPRLLAFSLMVLAATYLIKNSLLFPIIQPVAVNIASACLIWTCADPAPDWHVDWLALWPLRHIGRISYGIYIFHYFIPQAMQKYLPGIDLSTHSPYPEEVRMFILVGLSVAAAELSWFLVEQPILRWKDRVPGRRISYPGPMLDAVQGDTSS